MGQGYVRTLDAWGKRLEAAGLVSTLHPLVPGLALRRRPPFFWDSGKEEGLEFEVEADGLRLGSCPLLTRGSLIQLPSAVSTDKPAWCFPSTNQGKV